MNTDTRTVLVAGDGKLITDGTTYCKEVYLAIGADASVWYEINEEEYNIENENI